MRKRVDEKPMYAGLFALAGELEEGAENPDEISIEGMAVIGRFSESWKVGSKSEDY